MTDAGQHIASPERINPFPAAAVARLSEFDPNPLTVRTPALREAVARIEAFATQESTDAGRTTRTPANTGTVLALIGEYGTGKTHIAAQMLLRFAHVGGPDAHRVYLDAPSDTFLALYRDRFWPRLDRDEVRERVEAHYADVVADAVADAPLTAGVARRLRERRADPQEVIQRLGLMESDLLHGLRRRLRAVTEMDVFGTALALLRHPEFEDAVWEWLGGHPPDPVLRERGITVTIDDDTAALDALGVVAFLFGRGGHRLVVVVDEMEKVLPGAPSDGQEPASALKRLLDVFIGAGALLVLSGLPDFTAALPADVWQRIGHRLHPSPLTAEDTDEYIRAAQQRAFGEPRLAPFTRPVVDELVNLTGGNPRKIIKLCHQTYREATAKGTGVTAAMVRGVARAQFQTVTRDDLRSEVHRILDSGGWRFTADHRLGRMPQIVTDFWIPVSDEGAGCAVLVTDSVLQAGDVTELTRRARIVRASDTPREVLLAVNGEIAADLVTELSDAFTMRPVHYTPRGFTDVLTAVVSGAVRRLEQATREDELKIIRAHVERLGRQQSSTQVLVEQLSAAVDASRSATDRRLATLLRELGGPDAPGSPAGDAAPVDALPAAVSGPFERGLDLVAPLHGLDALLEQALGSGDSDADPPRTGARGPVGARFRSRESFQAIGVAVLLDKLLRIFRDSVGRWLSRVGEQRQGAPDDVERARLHAICHTYDAIYASLPVFYLDRLAELAELVTPAEAAAPPAFRSSWRAEARESLDGLGELVYRTCLTAVGWAV